MTSKKKPKLLFLVSGGKFFCSHRLPIACAAKKEGFDVVIATRVQNQEARIKKAGLKLIPLTLTRRSKNPFNELCSIWEIIKIYKREKPDIVHHVTLKPILYGSFAARVLKVPFVVNAIAGMGHFFISDFWQAKIFRSILKRLFRFLLNCPNGTVILQNPDDMEMLVGGKVIQPDRIAMIKGSGVDIDTFLPSEEPEGIPIVALASRMLWDKGIREFVDAARILQKEGIHAKFVLAGELDEDNPAGIAPGQLDSWNHDGIVEWVGHKEDMPKFLREVHIVCLPSYREGLPKILLEAAACARPIVATDVPGCREIVRNGENGLLVPPKDPVALAKAIKDLISRPDLRKIFGDQGREIVVNEFSEKKVIQATMKIYKEFLKI